MAKIQKIRLKDLLKPTGPSVNQPPSNTSPDTSSSTSKPKAGASSISTRSRPKVIKLDATGLSASQMEQRTVLEIDELSSDRRRVNKRILDVTGLSPMKKRHEGLGQERLVLADDGLSEGLLSILQDFSDRGFEFVPDSKAVPNVQELFAAATGTSTRRRYLSSVGLLTFRFVDGVII